MQDKKANKSQKMQAKKIPLTDLTVAQTDLFNYFDQLGIIHETYGHPPIMTVDEGADLKKHIPGAGGKSLFLTNKTGQYWLVVAKDDTHTDLKGLSIHLNTKRFSFGKPDMMLELLGVTPGSVTPFALLHDKDCILKVIIDQRLCEHEQVVFHPLKNDKSTVILSTDLLKFVQSLGHDCQILTLDQFEEA